MIDFENIFDAKTVESSASSYPVFNNFSFVTETTPMNYLSWIHGSLQIDQFQ